MSAVRVAVVGTGRMGREHLEALGRSSSCAAVAAVDPDAAAREAVAALVERTYGSLEELLEAGGFDAALIASPTGHHRATVEALAAQGVPMLCEKPAGFRVGDVVAATRAAADAGVLLQIGYWRRFVPDLIALRERIGEGSLGRPSLVISHQWDERPPSASFRSGSGGIAADMAVHEIDQLRWLTGEELEIVSAVAAGRDGVTDERDPDNAGVLGRLAGGAGVVFTLGRRFPPGDSCWIEVFGDGGYDRVPFMWGADNGDQTFHKALTAQLDAFAAAVQGERPSGATGDDAIAAISAAERITEALVASASPAVA